MSRYFDRYKGSCGSCSYLNLDKTSSTFRYYCERRGFYCSSTESKCSSYDLAEEGTRTRYNERDYYSLGRREHYWYIVNTILDVLKLIDYTDEFQCIDALRGFRCNILEKDAKYETILQEYDQVGPKLSEAIQSEPMEIKVTICKQLARLYLLPVLDLIREEKYEEAVSKYFEMVNQLKDIYPDVIDKEDIKTENMFKQLIKVRI